MKTVPPGTKTERPDSLETRAPAAPQAEAAARPDKAKRQPKSNAVHAEGTDTPERTGKVHGGKRGYERSPLLYVFAKLRELERAGKGEKPDLEALDRDVQQRYATGNDNEKALANIALGMWDTQKAMLTGLPWEGARAEVNVIPDEGLLKDAVAIGVTLVGGPPLLIAVPFGKGPLGRLLADAPGGAGEVLGVMPYDHTFYFAPTPKPVLQRILGLLDTATGDAALVARARAAVSALLQ
jgi:hypothetical protein